MYQLKKYIGYILGFAVFFMSSHAVWANDDPVLPGDSENIPLISKKYSPSRELTPKKTVSKKNTKKVKKTSKKRRK